MDISKQLQNNEQRVQLSSCGSLRQDMPGGNQVVNNEQHIIGYIPDGALLKGWTAFVGSEDEAWPGGVTVAVGTTENPTLFASALTVTSVNINDKALPMELYFPVGTEIVCTISAGSKTPGTGMFYFELDYSELNTDCGAHTA